MVTLIRVKTHRIARFSKANTSHSRLPSKPARDTIKCTTACPRPGAAHGIGHGRDERSVNQYRAAPERMPAEMLIAGALLA